VGAKNSILTAFNTWYGHLLPCNKHAPVRASILQGFVPFILVFSAKEHAIRLKLFKAGNPSFLQLAAHP
jgi:hypothetical protein